MGYGEGAATQARPPAPRLPFKESVGTVNEKLERLLTKIENFRSHLFPQPISPNAQTDPIPSPDFDEMLDRTHNLLSLIEDRFDSIRDRF